MPTFLSDISLSRDGDASTEVVTKQYVDLKANLASPTFTGTPAAPTAAISTATTQIATTAFVIGQVGNSVSTLTAGVGAGSGSSTRFSRDDHSHGISSSTLPVALGASNAVGSSTDLARADHVHIYPTPVQIGAAPLASPTFTGTPAAPTASVGTNTTQIATTAFVLANAGSAAVLKTGDTMTGDLSLSSAAGAARSLILSTGAAARWSIQKNPTAETGSSSGSDLIVIAHDDAGAAAGAVLSISRSTGVITSTYGMAVNTAPTVPTHVTNKDYVDARTPKITVATSAPSSPAVGDLWVNST